MNDLRERMDEAAQEAEVELVQLPPEALQAVGRWWLKWYMAAGHKRLGRLLIKYAKAAPTSEIPTRGDEIE